MVPTRLDVHNNLLEEGRSAEGKRGFFNQWVIETLVKRDVIVVDMFDQILFGTYAVSYTHLDVYKRQSSDRPFKIRSQKGELSGRRRARMRKGRPDSSSLMVLSVNFVYPAART